MARIVITRPNGEIEYAELTTNKAQAGNDRLAVEKAGTVYYAKLDKGISTHLYVIKPDGRKLYVQKKANKKKYKIRIDQDYPNQQEVNVTINGHYYCYNGVKEFDEGTEWSAWVYNRDGDYDNGHIVGDTSGILHSDIHIWAFAPTRKYKPFTWKYEVDDSHPIDGFVIPRTGKYKIVMHEMGSVNSRDFDRYIDYIYPFTKGARVDSDDRITTQDGKRIILRGDEWEGPPGESNGSKWNMKSIEYIGEA